MDSAVRQSTPLWLSLLRYQRRKRLTGFTPSFLIGAALPKGAKLDENTAYTALVSLLAAFRNYTPPGYEIVIAECTGHHQLQ